MSLSLPPLVDVQALSAHLEDPALRLFDATVDLVRPPEGGPYTVASGRPGYEQAHIPGAAFADIADELSDPASPIPFTVPPPEQFAAAAGRLGIGPGKHVVAYARDTPMWATRLWWLLRFFGFDAVSVLDGGLPAWRTAGLLVEPGELSYPAAQFVAQPRWEWLATRADVEAVVAAGDGSACLVNALTPPVFRGEGPSSYSRPGRIPRSVNAPCADRLEAWAEAGIDGINVMDAPGHGAFDDFGRHLAPVLQRRGLMQREYASGTLRQKLFRAAARLPPGHPAATHRR